MATVSLMVSGLCFRSLNAQAHSRARLSIARGSYTKVRAFTSEARGTMMENRTGNGDMSDTVRAGLWYAVPDLLLCDYHISVPLDHNSMDSDRITLFVREVIATGKKEQRMPYLLFLQGGPGFESPRPQEAGGWLKRACKEFRVILLDQRGTGLSTPLTTSSLSQLSSAQEQANYLQHFRADSIVKDAEYVRQFLVPDKEPWTVLGQVDLPSGGKLTPRGLQLLGLSGLGSSGGFERLHYLLERAWDPVLVHGAQKSLSSTFLRMFENWLSFDTNPLYALMHESIYCQGAASKWAAHRVRGEFGDQFDAVKAAKGGQPVFFTGEMVFPWMFDEFAALRPLKEVANLLAGKDDWPALYDEAALRSNRVPVAAAAYYEDMYVSFGLSEETANTIAGARLWVTNEYMHSGLRDDGARLLDYLFDMLRGKRLLQ